MKNLLLTIGFLMLLSCGKTQKPAPGQGKGSTAVIKYNAAMNGLGKFKNLINSNLQLQKSIFVSIDSSKHNQQVNDNKHVDLANLRLGRAVPSALIRIDSLRKFRAGKQISSLLVEGGQVIFPVIDQTNNNLSTVTIESINDEWKAAGFGLEKEAIRDAMPYLSLKNDSLKLLKIPALRAYFISYKKAGDTYLVPLQEDKANGLKRNVEYKAGMVLEKYVAQAKLYNGLPR